MEKRSWKLVLYLLYLFSQCCTWMVENGEQMEVGGVMECCQTEPVDNTNQAGK